VLFSDALKNLLSVSGDGKIRAHRFVRLNQNGMDLHR